MAVYLGMAAFLCAGSLLWSSQVEHLTPKKRKMLPWPDERFAAFAGPCGAGVYRLLDFHPPDVPAGTELPPAAAGGQPAPHRNCCLVCSAFFSAALAGAVPLSDIAVFCAQHEPVPPVDRRHHLPAGLPVFKKAEVLALCPHRAAGGHLPHFGALLFAVLLDFELAL